MLLLDAALRISGATMLLLTALIALRDARHLLQGKLAFALCLTLSAMLINTMPSEMGLPGPIKFVVGLLQMPNIIFLWLFGLSLFQDDFKLTRIHLAALIAAPALIFLERFCSEQGLDALVTGTIVVNRFLQFGVLFHLLWTAIAGRKDDLVENRRRTRLWFVMGIAIAAILVVTAETTYFAYSGASYDPSWLSTLRVGIIWPMVLFGALWFLNMRPEHLLFEPSEPSAPRVSKIAPKDAATHKRLSEAMDNDQVFTEQGLTIGGLAEKISVPEHQLRALINQGLGYRNFASFLNFYRIRFAKEILSDPEKVRLPVLTIAMDAGYNSLAPFNRAFKASEGVTPTAFRAAAIENTVQS